MPQEFAWPGKDTGMLSDVLVVATTSQQPRLPLYLQRFVAQHEQIPSEIFSVVVPWDSTASTTLRPSGPEHNSLAFTTDPIISPCLSILSLLFP